MRVADDPACSIWALMRSWPAFGKYWKAIEWKRTCCSPQAVVAFLHAMQRDAPDSLAGIVWFRLPTESDRRAWSPDTWRAVVTDHLPAATLSATLVATDSPSLWTVTLSNEGVVDAATPRRVRLDPGCILADGANGFRLVDGAPSSPTNYRPQRSAPRWSRPTVRACGP